VLEIIRDPVDEAVAGLAKIFQLPDLIPARAY
jgi:hypothetical protein